MAFPALIGWALLLAPAAVPAQEGDLPEVSYPAITDRAVDAAGFVPDGWRLEQIHGGDLDDDGRDDLVLVLEMADPANRIDNEGLGPDVFDTNPRMLVAAFAEDGGYRRVLSDHVLVPRPYSPTLDDFLGETGGVEVDGGALRVTLHMWASAGTWFTSSTGFTFRYRDGCFRLVGYDKTGMHRASGEIETVSVNYLTRRAWRSQGSISDDGEPERTWLRMPKQPLRCLEDVGNGLGFDPGLPLSG
ncbi:MAG: hypothetical protein L0H23_02535 [Luteimonas sp.]|nr:hypothetical protein [Luteimonas sp.]